MPRKPDVPCSGTCGRMLWRGSTSAAPGEMRCRECRKVEPVPYGQRVERPVATCPTCHGDFVSYPRQSTFCSRSCANARARESSTPVRSGRTCAVCSVTFTATYADQVTCGRACGAVYRKSRYVPPPPMPAKVYACGMCGNKRTAGDGAGAWTRYCSNQCRIDSAGLRIGDLYGATLSLGLRGGHWLALLREYLRERDGDRCQICMRMIRFDLASGPKGDPSGLGPSVDHLIPRSRGGGDDPANLRLTHWVCNRARGADRGTPTQLALIG